MSLITEGERAKLAMELADLATTAQARTLAYKSAMAQTKARLAAIKETLSGDDAAEVQGVIDGVDAAVAKVS